MHRTTHPVTAVTRGFHYLIMTLGVRRNAKT